MDTHQLATTNYHSHMPPLLQDTFIKHRSKIIISTIDIFHFDYFRLCADEAENAAARKISPLSDFRKPLFVSS